VERTAVDATSELVVRIGGLGERLVRRQRDEGVKLRIQRFDSGQVSLHQLPHREPLPAQPGGRFFDGQVMQ